MSCHAAVVVVGTGLGRRKGYGVVWTIDLCSFPQSLTNSLHIVSSGDIRRNCYYVGTVDTRRTRTWFPLGGFCIGNKAGSFEWVHHCAHDDRKELRLRVGG